MQTSYPWEEISSGETILAVNLLFPLRILLRVFELQSCKDHGLSRRTCHHSPRGILPKFVSHRAKNAPEYRKAFSTLECEIGGRQ